jgi:hypothetical protein
MFAGLLAIPEAQAANGSVPRTRPEFVDPACLRIVDRAADPTFHLDVAIPFEDTELTIDEPEDARTFQFFAVCRDFHAGEALPTWLDDDDVMRSIVSGAIEAPPPATDVLAGNAAWSVGHDGAEGTCVQAIVPKADRIPISCDGTAGGVDWDASAVPAGNYVLWGYTFQPSLNVWTRRRGVVRVIDGDDADLPPVVSLMSPVGEPDVWAEDGFRLVGCMAGVPGTTVALEWAAVNEDLDDPASWAAIGGPLDAAEGTFDLLFVPPADAVGQAVLVRATATDPSGRSWTAYTSGALIVLPGDGCSDPPEPPAPIDFCDAYPDPEEGEDACADGGVPMEGSGGSSGGTGDGPDPVTGSSSSGDASSAADPGGSAGDDGGGGCNCRARGPARGGAWWSLFAIAGLFRARARLRARAWARARARRTASLAGRCPVVQPLPPI